MAEQIKVNSPEVFSPEGTSSPEKISAPERFEPASETLQSTPTDTPVVPSIAPLTTPSPQDMVHAQRIADIEHILEEDLQEIYTKLAPADKEKFRLGGEAAAKEINTILSSASVTLKKIVDVITNWLKIIPGVSKFFLEQEAKIKADRLYKLSDR